jgi:hypothetical protein
VVADWLCVYRYMMVMRFDFPKGKAVLIYTWPVDEVASYV